MNLRAAIRDLYTQVHAPDWAAPNLDALADVLRDLSWLPLGPVELNRPHRLTAGDARRLADVLDQAMAETAERAAAGARARVGRGERAS